MRQHGFRPTWSLVVCVLVVLGIALTVPGTILAKKGGGGGGKDTSERVHYFVWYAPDALGAFSPDGSLSIAGGVIADPDTARLTINPGMIKSASILPGVSPFALKADNDVDASAAAEIEACFPEDVFHDGTHSVYTDADGTVTVQMNLYGLSSNGRPGRWYNLFIDV